MTWFLFFEMFLILSVVNRRCHSTNGGSKELSFCHNLRFLILISLTPNVVDLSNYKFCLLKSLILKYLRFAPSGCKDIRNRKFEFVADFCQIFVYSRKKSTGLGQGLTFFFIQFFVFDLYLHFWDTRKALLRTRTETACTGNFGPVHNISCEQKFFLYTLYSESQKTVEKKDDIKAIIKCVWGCCEEIVLLVTYKIIYFVKWDYKHFTNVVSQVFGIFKVITWD